MSVRRDRDASQLIDAVIVGRVDAIVPGGAGIVRDRDGVVFAKGGLPGELVRIGIDRVQKRVRHGHVLAVLEPSPARVASDCPWHPRCGGCDLLELGATDALGVRSQIVRDALVRVGKIAPDVVDRALQPIAHAPVGSPDALRRRVRVVVGDGGAATFSQADSHDRVPIAHCAAVVPALDAALALLPGAKLPVGTELRLAADDRGHVSAALDDQDPMLCARLVDAGVAKGAVSVDVVDGTELSRAGDPLLLGEVTAGAFLCMSDASVFTQATRFGGAAIRDVVVQSVDTWEGRDVLELFAGSGHLTLPMAARGAHIDALEGSDRAVAFLDRNKGFIRGRITPRTAYIDAKTPFPLDRYDVLVVDPPRTGIIGFDAIVKRARPKMIVMVSCDVATGARDIAVALKRGYELVGVVPIDAFPRTSHVEWVASLRAAS